MGVAAQGGIVAPVPVVMQAGFDLEPLAGEAGVVGGGADDGVDATPGLPDGVPDAGLRGGGHLDRAVEVIDADAVGDRRRVDGADNGEGTINDSARAHGGGDLGLVKVDVFARGAGGPGRTAAGGRTGYAGRTPPAGDP